MSRRGPCSADDGLRLAQGGGFHDGLALGYQDTLAELLENAGDSLRGLAVYHIRELGLTHLQSRVSAVQARRSGFLESILETTADMRARPAQEPAS